MLNSGVSGLQNTRTGTRPSRAALAGTSTRCNTARFTVLFEALVIDWSLASSLSAVARLLRLSWDQVAGIQTRAVVRGPARRGQQMPARIRIDERSFQKRHEYVTVVCDLDAPKDNGVLVVADDRNETSVTPFFERLGQWGRRAITDCHAQSTTGCAIPMPVWLGHPKPPRSDHQCARRIAQHAHSVDQAVDQAARLRLP